MVRRSKEDPSDGAFPSAPTIGSVMYLPLPAGPLNPVKYLVITNTVSIHDSSRNLPSTDSSCYIICRLENNVPL